MNVNIWNLFQTKTSFFIRERKEAQKRHLNKLKHIKSTIDLKSLNMTSSSKLFTPIINQSRLVQSRCDASSLDPSFNEKTQQSSILASVGQRHRPANNTSYMENLRVSSSLSRLRQTRQIERQNSKLIERLIKAKPSVSEKQFRKNHLNHLKYKENILKNKCNCFDMVDLNPDYTRQVKDESRSFGHLLLKPIQNLICLKGKSQASRVKTLANQELKNSYLKNAHPTCHSPDLKRFIND